MKTKQIIIPAPNMWSKTQDVYVTPKGLHRIGYEENYMAILRNKSKKGHKIIEASNLYKELKGFIQWIGFFMIIGGLYLIGQGLWLKFTT